MNPFRDREIITPDDEEDIADRKAAYEREIDRADYLRDERRDREMEERETAREIQSGNVIQSELSRLRAENMRLRAFIESIVNAYAALNGRQLIDDILRNSMPKAVEPAPPVPESLKRSLRSGNPDEELLAEHEANPESFREPLPFRTRFFKDTKDGYQWKWDGRNMSINQSGCWMKSIFRNPIEILEEIDVIETDEAGNPLTPDPNA